MARKSCLRVLAMLQRSAVGAGAVVPGNTPSFLGPPGNSKPWPTAHLCISTNIRPASDREMGARARARRSSPIGQRLFHHEDATCRVEDPPRRDHDRWHIEEPTAASLPSAPSSVAPSCLDHVLEIPWVVKEPSARVAHLLLEWSVPAARVGWLIEIVNPRNAISRIAISCDLSSSWQLLAGVLPRWGRGEMGHSAFFLRTQKSLCALTLDFPGCSTLDRGGDKLMNSAVIGL